MIFQELLFYCKMQALEDLLNPSEETFWRSITRSYSQQFHVPLPQVREMDPEAVIREVFEAKYEEIDVVENIESLLEDIYKISDPGYSKQQREEMDSFIKNVEKREQKRLGKLKEKEEKQQNVLRKQPPKPMPTGGCVDFSKLRDDK